MPKKPKLTIVGGSAKPKGKPGRKPWEPTPLQRRTVERCMGIGLSYEQTAAVVGCSVTSMWRHCKTELEHGGAKIRAKVGGKLIARALQGDTACLIFFCKTQLGWSEKQIHEHTGAGGGPIRHETLKADADAFTDRIFALAARHLAARVPTIEAEALKLAPPAEPSEIN